jgi:Putative peptidoglycan binding domain
LTRQDGVEDWFDDEGETVESVRRDRQGAGPTDGIDRHRLGRVARRPVRVEVVAGTAVVSVVVALLIAIAFDGTARPAADRAYLAGLDGPARASQAVGTTLVSLLGRRGLSRGQLESGLSGLVQRQGRDTAETLKLAAAPRLRGEQERAVEVMELRLGGLEGLLAGVRRSASNRKSDWAAVLGAEGDRLITSDVIWSDLFVAPTRTQSANDGLRNASVPRSTFVDRPDLVEAPAMAALLARIGAPTSQTSATVKPGDSGPQVAAWQRQLNRWLACQPGQTRLAVTGTFDPATEHATLLLQAAEHITADGIAGPVTQAALAKALGG